MASEPHHAHNDPPGGGSWADMAEELVAEAELLAPVRDDELTILHRLLGGQAVARVLDFGCGPGVTTAALARSFPDATVAAVDGSAELLDQARRRATAAGVGDRVTTMLGDLEGDGGGPGPFDVVWASMVLHHLADLDGALDRLVGRVTPGGWLAVTEFGSPLSMLPADDEVVTTGAWDRISAASRQVLADHLPHGHIGDWTQRLTAAGFAEVSQRECVLDRSAPLGEAERTWLSRRLRRERQAVADRLGDDDLAAVDRLLDPASGILVRADLHLRVGRLFVTGQRPVTVGATNPS